VKAYIKILLVIAIPVGAGFMNWTGLVRIVAQKISSSPVVSSISVLKDDFSPRLSPRERLALAFPSTRVGFENFMNRLVYNDIEKWPQMRYVGEYAQIGGKNVTIMDVKVVQGGSVTKAYAPETGQMGNALRGTTDFRLSKMPVLIIPPEASLVMVRIEVDQPWGYMSDEGQYICTYHDEPNGSNFRLAYPGLGETDVRNTFFHTDPLYEFGEFNSPNIMCLGNGWLYFYIAKLEVDPTKLWLEYIHHEDIAFWTLTERP